MSLNATPASERIHIGIFGKRNAGKSSLINALTGQNLAIVSDVSGTTTDPVYKAMELLPLGPVVVIDTPGIDDEGELGKLRVKKSYQVLNKTDIVLLVCSAVEGITEEEQKLLKQIEKKQIPCILVMNKADLLEECQKGQQFKERAENAASVRGQKIPVLWVSAAKNLQIRELKEKIASGIEQKKPEYPLVEDLLEMGDFAVLVVPIDKAAPKGRLILPQQQTIRDILERGALSLVVRDTELKDTLEHFRAQGIRPRLVVTDSQAFARVSRDTPEDITLTSFSILFAIRESKARRNGSVTIEAMITVNVERCSFSTGKQVAIEKWDKNKQQVRGKDEETVSLNNYLKAVKAKLYGKEAELLDRGFVITAQLLYDAYFDKVACLKERSLLSVLEEHNAERKAMIKNESI